MLCAIKQRKYYSLMSLYKQRSRNFINPACLDLKQILLAACKIVDLILLHQNEFFRISNPQINIMSYIPLQD